MMRKRSLSTAEAVWLAACALISFAAWLHGWLT